METTTVAKRNGGGKRRRQRDGKRCKKDGKNGGTVRQSREPSKLHLTTSSTSTSVLKWRFLLTVRSPGGQSTSATSVASYVCQGQPSAITRRIIKQTVNYTSYLTRTQRVNLRVAAATQDINTSSKKYWTFPESSQALFYSQERASNFSVFSRIPHPGDFNVFAFSFVRVSILSHLRWETETGVK